MSRQLYRAVVALSPLCAGIAAVAGALGAFRLAVVFLALCCASIPVLLHLQTQRIVTIARTSESRVEKAIVKRLKGGVAGHDSGEADAVAAELRRAIGELQKETSADSLSVAANEFRRETRMTRLIMSELLAASRSDDKQSGT